MFLGIYGLDDYVNIPAETHRFSSGAAYAPTVLTYSIYEEGNTTGLDEDVDMTPASPFDSITGFYLARRQLTAAAGFENNKTYIVVVKATVDSVSAITSHVFQIRPQQTGDSFAIVNGDHGLVSIQDDIDTLLARIVGTLASGTHNAQTGDSYAKVNDATIGLANLKALIDALQADIGDASGSTLGSLYAILGNAAAAITGRIPAALESGNIPAITKAQDNIDFGALQKASLNAATPSVAVSDKTGFSLTAAYDAAKTAGTSTLTAQQVWEYATRTLSAFGFNVTVGTNNDKTGYALTVTPPTASDIKTALEADGSKLDHLWETTEDDGGVRRFTANALEESPAGGSAPTASEVADAVWDEVLSGHVLAGSAGAALSSAGTAGDPWITELPGSYAAGTAGYRIGHMSSLGAGAITWAYTLTDDNTSAPIDGAEVWITTDSAGVNIIASGITDQNGTVTFYLDAGMVYVWRKRAGYNFTNPDQETVS